MPITPRQVTFTPWISHPSYFLQSSFYPEGGLFFVSYASGAPQLQDTDLAGGFRQLTHGPAIHPFSPAYREGELIFTRQGALWAIEPLTLRERLIVEYPAGASMGEPSLSRDGWAAAAIKLDGRNGLVTGPLHPREPGAGWSFIPFPRTVIHPQFHPLEPEWIEFSGDPAPRMHRVRRDGTGLECLYEHGNDEFIVHETFLGSGPEATGDIVFTVWPHRVCRMDWTTRAIREIRAFNAWHIAPDAAGKRILCDTNHPDRGIHLIDAATGELEFVCHSHASSGGSQWKTSRYALAADFAAARSQAQSRDALSWMEASVDTVYGPQWTHPHPSWSRDERQIAFASDQSGVTQVYVCALPE